MLNPQSLNRYAYALNNPVNFIDPLGLTCIRNDDGFTVDNMDGKGCDEISGNTPGTVGVSGQPGVIPTVPTENPGTITDAGLDPGDYPGPGPVPSGTNTHVGPGPGGAGGGGGDGTPAEVATQYCQDNGQIAFNIPFTDIPVTMSLSFTVANVNYSLTNDITAVAPALPIPPFLSFGGSLDFSVNAPKTPAPTLSVGAGKNASVGSYLTPKGWQGLTVSVGPSIGPPVNFTLPPGNACGKRAEKSGG